LWEERGRHFRKGQRRNITKGTGHFQQPNLKQGEKGRKENIEKIVAMDGGECRGEEFSLKKGTGIKGKDKSTETLRKHKSKCGH